MTGLRFEWDEAKNKENLGKHGVSFKEAEAVFSDKKSLWFLDPDDSTGEDRFVIVGISMKLRVLVVCHCFRNENTVIRIISARKAEKWEAKDYWR